MEKKGMSSYLVEIIWRSAVLLLLLSLLLFNDLDDKKCTSDGEEPVGFRNHTQFIYCARLELF